MYWKITCYNGDTWEAPYQMLLSEALVLFMKETGNIEWSIKSVVNLH